MCNLSRAPIVREYKAIKKLFLKLLQNGEFKGQVIIFLDGLDQLSAEDGAHLLDWMPNILSENVKLIVSTIPQEHGLLSRYLVEIIFFEQQGWFTQEQQQN